MIKRSAVLYDLDMTNLEALQTPLKDEDFMILQAN